MSKLELLARISTARTASHFRAALNAWTAAGYGPVPTWALDAYFKHDPPTLDDYRRNMGEKP
jgi:hypothetical protein